VGSTEQRALVVDDEQHLRNLVQGYLEREGFVVEVADNGRTALELARQHPPTVVVLDLMLPEMDGLEVCRQLRTFSDAYVIMLTAKAEEIDRIIGLEVGADDYLTKPFSPRELIARIRAMLRRPRHHGGPGAPVPDSTPPQRFGELTIDHERREAVLAGDIVPLTPLEFALLTTLAAHPGRAFTRAQLLERVWGEDYFGDDHVVDVHIANLRRKLGEDSSAPRFVETVRGVGYRFAGRAA
jgi:two-component system, OmpR family, alkaline phosphatase synthesis response regulator PhoP